MGTTRTRQPGSFGFDLFLADRVNLGRREPFVALGEGIEGRAVAAIGGHEILRTALAFGGEDDPGVVERIAAKFGRHEENSNRARWLKALRRRSGRARRNLK